MELDLSEQCSVVIFRADQAAESMPLEQGHGDAVEVSANSDVVDADDADDVVEVVDQRLEWRPSEASGEFTVDLVGEAEGNGFSPLVANSAARAACARGGTVGANGEDGLAVVLVDEGGVEVDHADAAVGRESPELVVGEIARRVGEARGRRRVRGQNRHARGTARTSAKVLSEAWETSIIMPRWFISAMTS